jgi:hypothetical protein
LTALENCEGPALGTVARSITVEVNPLVGAEMSRYDAIAKTDNIIKAAIFTVVVCPERVPRASATLMVP